MILLKSMLTLGGATPRFITHEIKRASQCGRRASPCFNHPRYQAGFSLWEKSFTCFFQGALFGRIPDGKAE